MADMDYLDILYDCRSNGGAFSSVVALFCFGLCVDQSSQLVAITDRGSRYCKEQGLDTDLLVSRWSMLFLYCAAARK